jgi:Nuclease subunit of the excinuclease complex
MQVLDYTFSFVDILKPNQDKNGKIIEYQPQKNYLKKDPTKKLHKYGEGSFCEFSIDPKWSGVAGVYIYVVNDVIIYVGQCRDLAKRFNTGYGSISPRACFAGGQSTNCKMNKIVLENTQQGKEVNLYFLRTHDFDKIERELIKKLLPEHNVSLKQDANLEKEGLKNNRKENLRYTTPKKSNNKYGKYEIEKYIQLILFEQKQKGKTSVVLISGDIHKELNLHSAMPSVCNAMYSKMKSGDKVLKSTPSGYSSTIQIEYFL